MQFLGKSGQITTLPLFVVGDQWDVYRPLVARVSQHALRRGVSTPAECLLWWEVWSRVCLPPPPPPWTEWQTGVKKLPCRNFVAGGKNMSLYGLALHCGKSWIRHWAYFCAILLFVLQCLKLCSDRAKVKAGAKFFWCLSLIFLIVFSCSLIFFRFRLVWIGPYKCKTQSCQTCMEALQVR